VRVLVFSTQYAPTIGGIQTLLGHLLPALRARGHDVAVITSAVEGQAALEERSGVVVHRFPLERPLIERELPAVLSARRSVARVRRSFNADVVHVQDPGAAAWFQIRTRGSDPAPVVLTMQRTFDQIRGGASSAAGAALRDADRVVAVSDAVRHDVSRIESNVRHIVTIKNAVPAPREEPSPVPVAPVQLAMIGRLAHQKGFDIGLRAIARVAGYLPDCRVVVAGDGPEAEALTNLAAELCLSQRIEWLGPQTAEEVAGVLRASTLVVMPSRDEGFPLVALEAAGLGRVVVGARTPGLDEVVVDGVTGMLVPPEDEVGLATAIETLLADVVGLQTIARAARDRAVTDLSFDRCVDSHETLYRSLTAH
jgi:glycogen(starch) synthase